MANEIRYGYASSNTLNATLRNSSGQVWYVAGQTWETWGTSSRTMADYAIAMTDKGGGLYMADMPTGVPRMTLSPQVWQQVGATAADTDLLLGYADYPYGAIDVSSGSLSATGLTGAQMVSEVQALTGTTSDDEPIATQTQITRWLNRGQIEIARECPGLQPLVFKNTTSLDTTQSLCYSMDDITAGDSTLQTIAHLYKVWYADGYETEELIYLPTDQFDERYPDPTHSDLSPDKPHYWTRRNRNIEIMPLSACAYCNYTLRVDGDLYPRDFTVNSTYYTDISLGVEDGLITYAVWKYYEAIGDEQRAVLWGTRWSNDVPNEAARGWLEKFKDAHEAMPEWAGDILYADY